MYNATEQYAKMEQRVQEWERGLLEHDEAGMPENIPEEIPCKHTRVDLRVVVTNIGNSTEATVHEISVRRLVDNETAYEESFAHTLAPESEPFERNVTVYVAPESSVQVQVLVSNSTDVQVLILHAEAAQNITSFDTSHPLQHEYTLCAEQAEANLVQVRTPAAFERLHTFLDAQLCAYA
jgi:hypothetical protein